MPQHPATPTPLSPTQLWLLWLFISKRHLQAALSTPVRSVQFSFRFLQETKVEPRLDKHTNRHTQAALQRTEPPFSACSSIKDTLHIKKTNMHTRFELKHTKQSRQQDVKYLLCYLHLVVCFWRLELMPGAQDNSAEAYMNMNST